MSSQSKELTTKTETTGFKFGPEKFVDTFYQPHAFRDPMSDTNAPDLSANSTSASSSLPYAGDAFMFDLKDGMWKFVEVAPFRRAFLDRLEGRTPYLPIPIGCWSWDDPNAKQLLRDVYRYMIHTAERRMPECVDYDKLQHMYTTLICGMLLQLDSWDTMGSAKQTTHMNALFIMVSTMRNLIAGSHPDAVRSRKIVEAVAELPAGINQLERAVAFLLLDRPIDGVDLLKMFEASVRRSKRPSRLDQYVAYGIGLMAMFLAVPIVQSAPSFAECITRFEAMKKLLTERFSAIPASHPDMPSEALAVFASVSPLFERTAITPAIAKELLAHTGAAPFRWGTYFPDLFLELGFNVKLGPFSAAGGTTPASDLQVISRSTAKVTSRSGKDWSGIQVMPQYCQSKLSSGIFSRRIFKITIGLLGNAKGAAGDTLGAELTANVRFTTGSNLLDKKKVGVALSGMVSGDGSFRQLEDPMDPTCSITLTIEADGRVIIMNGPRLLKTTLRVTEREALLIAFKNCILTIEEIAVAAPAEPMASNSSSSVSYNSAAAPKPTEISTLELLAALPFTGAEESKETAEEAERKLAVAGAQTILQDIRARLEAVTKLVNTEISTLHGKDRAMHLSSLAKYKEDQTNLRSQLAAQELMIRVLSKA